MYFNHGNGRVLKDVGTSSRNGAWALRGQAKSELGKVIVRVLRKRIDRHLGNNHHHVCARVVAAPVVARNGLPNRAPGSSGSVAAR